MYIIRADLIEYGGFTGNLWFIDNLYYATPSPSIPNCNWTYFINEATQFEYEEAEEIIKKLEKPSIDCLRPRAVYEIVEI